MSKLETPMTRWYWQQVGGTLIEEFPVVEKTATCGRRLLDAVIILGEETRIAHWSEVTIEGKDVVVVQTKASRLGMYLMGQAIFSAKLIERFKPRSVLSIALVKEDDSVLRQLLEEYPNVRVVVCSGLPTDVAVYNRKRVINWPL